MRQEPGFDKNALNEIAAMFGHAAVASPYDGAPASKPGCSSRHLEAQTGDAGAEALDLHSKPGREASVIELEEDPVEYCYRMFGDALPVVPPTVERVEAMLGATVLDRREVSYQKFRAPESIKIVVAGGTAGKFSAVLGSWTVGPRGSQMVTYPV